MALDFVSDPAVSCVLFPADSSDWQIELFVSDDYGVGKLIRCGKDAIHGYDRRGRRIYDPGTVRRGLRTLDEHIGPYKQPKAARKAQVHQGHGNIGLNNWAVAYLDGPHGLDLIVPAGEPMFERIYPCFVKRDGDPPIYDIVDLAFFCTPESVGGLEVVDWDATAKKPSGANVVEDPDRELEGNAVYLPLWDDRLTGQMPAICRPDGRIDWTDTATRFVKVPRNCRGTIDHFRPLLVPCEPPSPTDLAGITCRFGQPLNKVRLAFFGIPVETLAPEKHYAGSGLADLVHYFYDLRHLIDLIGVGRPEFYLLEHELKKDGFAKARALLSGQATIPPLSVNLADLLAIATRAGASPSVLKQLNEFCTNPDSLRNALVNKGYIDCGQPGAIDQAGKFCVAPLSSSAGPGPTLHLWPVRNCYSYSFIGTLEKGEKSYVMLATTGGISGQRPGGSTFGCPIRASLDLESAVRAIVNMQLVRLWGEGDWCQRLLLLDQGGDVHQWIGTGGVNYVVGSYIDRSLLSAMLAILAT